jgi:hypothetical protein
MGQGQKVKKPQAHKKTAEYLSWVVIMDELDLFKVTKARVKPSPKSHWALCIRSGQDRAESGP